MMFKVASFNLVDSSWDWEEVFFAPDWMEDKVAEEKILKKVSGWIGMTSEVVITKL